MRISGVSCLGLDPDGSFTNGSSIAVLLEHRGASVLLAADAFPQVLGAALLTLAKARSQQPLPVDVLKLSHHGSRGNLVTELLNAVQATRYVVSTNNSRFGHPDDEALARVVMYGGDVPTLCFNYATEHNLRWADEQVQRTYHFRTEFPRHAGSGMTVRVPAMESFARTRRRAARDIGHG